MTTTPDTEAPAPEAPEAILSLLRAQNALYGELESLAGRQRSLISADHTGPLLTLLGDRQKISGKLRSIAGRLEPARRDWDAYRERLTPSQRDEAEQLLAETGRRLQRVIERDEEDARLLSARKRTARQSLGATHATGQALAAYRVSPSRVGCFDRTDEDL